MTPRPTPLLCLLILLAINALIIAAHAQERWPVFPPAVDGWQMNVTYNAGIHERLVENLKGSVHYAHGNTKVAVHADDPLRTSEVILFRFDKNKEMTMGKFGEFPWQCNSGKIGRVIGVPNFVPPAGFDAAWFRSNAQYEGRETLDGKTVDVFRVQADSKPSKKVAKLYFLEKSDVLVRIIQTTVDKEGEFEYVMDVQGVAAGAQNPALFEVPQGARC